MGRLRAGPTHLAEGVEELPDALREVSLRESAFEVWRRLRAAESFHRLRLVVVVALEGELRVARGAEERPHPAILRHRLRERLEAARGGVELAGEVVREG